MIRSFFLSHESSLMRFGPGSIPNFHMEMACRQHVSRLQNFYSKIQPSSWFNLTVVLHTAYSNKGSYSEKSYNFQ